MKTKSQIKKDADIIDINEKPYTTKKEVEKALKFAKLL